MITYKILILILIAHWVADFICQTDSDAKGKSTSWAHLLSHTSMYSIIWVLVWLGVGAFYDNVNLFFSGLWFCLITFAVHTVTDYITSREVKKLFDKEDFHNGFVVIGLDQLLHYTQLFLTYEWLIAPHF